MLLSIRRSESFACRDHFIAISTGQQSFWPGWCLTLLIPYSITVLLGKIPYWGGVELAHPGQSPLRVGRQERFCLKLASGMTQQESYIAAGYRGRGRQNGNAANLAKKPNVRARVDYLRRRTAEQVAEVAAVTQSEVIEGFRENIIKAKEGTAILAKDGSPTGEFRRDFSSVNRGYELLGKSMGMFIDVTKTEDFDSELRQMDKAAVEELLTSLLEQLDPNMRKNFAEKLRLSSPPDEEESDLPPGEILQ